METGPIETGPMEHELADLDRALAAREAELAQQLAELSKPPTEASNISFGKRVGDGTQMAVDRMVAVGAHEQIGRMLAEIKDARARIAAGDYGRCEACGRQIPAARLEVRPSATRCVACA